MDERESERKNKRDRQRKIDRESFGITKRDRKEGTSKRE